MQREREKDKEIERVEAYIIKWQQKVIIIIILGEGRAKQH